MTRSRRFFLQPMGLGAGSGLGGAKLFKARGREALGAIPPWELDARQALPSTANAIRLSSSENPVGTRDEMQRALGARRGVLGARATAQG